MVMEGSWKVMQFEFCIPDLKKSWNFEKIVWLMEKSWNFSFSQNRFKLIVENYVVLLNWQQMGC